jgi:hypothetical protein
MTTQEHTDRELLELAAKAAGYTSYGYGELVGGCPALVLREADFTGMWAPLTDDGDALRLACRLNLTVKIMGDHVKVGWRGCGEQWPGEEVPANAREVMPVATRRAITRAAAQIGKDMP